jgi:hypothetical protein
MVNFITSLRNKLGGWNTPNYNDAKYNAFDAFSWVANFTDRNYNDIINSEAYSKLQPEQKITMKELLQIIVNVPPTDIAKTYLIIDGIEENLTKHFDAVNFYLDEANAAVNQDRHEDAFKNAHIAKDMSVPFCQMRAKVQTKITALSSHNKYDYFGSQIEDKEAVILDYATKFQDAFVKAQWIMNQAKGQLQIQNASANTNATNNWTNANSSNTSWLRKLWSNIWNSIANIFTGNELPPNTYPPLITDASAIPVPDKDQLTSGTLMNGNSVAWYEISWVLYEFERQNIWIKNKRYHIIRRKWPPFLYALIDDKKEPKIQWHFLKYEFIYSRDKSKVIWFEYMADSTKNDYKRVTL